MKKAILILSAVAIFSLNSYAQDIDASELRKLVMKSDVIFATDNYQTISNYPNDFSIEQFYLVNRIDTMIENKTQFKTDNKIRIQQHVNDYSAFWSENIASAISLMSSINLGVHYSDLFFLKKEGKQYKLLGIIGKTEWDKIITYYLPAIAQIREIDKITNLRQRYSKTIDWFIENDSYPDDDFIAYYKQQGIIKENIVLTDQQLQKAKAQFFKGGDDLLPLIQDTFAVEIKQFFLDKLKKIKNLSKKGYSEYYDFQKIIETMYEFDYRSIDYFLMQHLTFDYINEHDKEYYIMEYFIKKVEQELNEEQK